MLFCNRPGFYGSLLGDGSELTGGDTGAALDALHRIDGQGGLLFAGGHVVGLGDGGGGAGPGAHTAADAFILINRYHDFTPSLSPFPHPLPLHEPECLYSTWHEDCH